MKKKQIETLLYSVAGVAAMLIIVLVVNFIVGTFKQPDGQIVRNVRLTKQAK